MAFSGWIDSERSYPGAFAISRGSAKAVLSLGAGILSISLCSDSLSHRWHVKVHRKTIKPNSALDGWW